MSNESPLFNLRNYILQVVHEDKDNFLGVVLTVIDASTPDPEQRKALKDVLRQNYYKTFSRDNEPALRTMLLEFAEKYAPELAPKTEDEKESFLGRIPKGEMGVMTAPKWFN